MRHPAIGNRPVRIIVVELKVNGLITKKATYVKRYEMQCSACIKGSLGLPKINARKSGTPNFLRYLVIYNKNLERIYVLFSLRMAVLLHKREFKNTEVEFLKVSEKFDHQDFQILELGSPGTS